MWIAEGLMGTYCRCSQSRNLLRGGWRMSSEILFLRYKTSRRNSAEHISQPHPHPQNSTDSTPTPVFIFAQDLMIPNVLTVKSIIVQTCNCAADIRAYV
jgi:hypothetical protein